MTIRFGFYGRVSTEDQQDPEASRNWQRTRALALVESHGQLVTEYFDIGHSRSLPWKRRPEATRLLEALKDPHRGFDAVVIGEPQRAFYGNQYSLTFPVFEHYGVGLWVPEVGGPIDPSSEAHDLIMGVFGGMSKGERNRIKIRVRTAMGSQAQIEGRFLGGRPPYGYRLTDAGPHPNPAKAADGKRLHQLELDPETAPVVERIFHEYLRGTGVFAIAQQLTAEGTPSPAARDRQRNPHRCGIAWSKSAVRTILTNPRYMGRQVWGKQRKHEQLLDVEDVALGHQTRMRWNEADDWLWSTDIAHAPIVNTDTFNAVQQRLASRGPRSTKRATARAKHPYAFKGLLYCGLCNRRMQGTWNHDRAHYRCRFPSEYAIANKLDHPRSVYLREDQLTPALDSWLAEVFAPDRVRSTLEQLADNQKCSTTTDEEAVTALRQKVAGCRRKLERHKEALEAGADASLVAGWSSEVQNEKAAAEAQLAQLQSASRRTRPMTATQIHKTVRALGGLLTVLQRASPEDKAEVYRQLDLTMTYDPTRKMVLVKTRPRPSVDQLVVSEGGLEPPRPLVGH
ncbi:recombinase family protein [Allosaccharopolyspora coralli]|uniref:Recombinase family protein n=1 Tax=Allosaccharopolyspora coralli TaxID=2665642 RepID=A0A5Q3QL48_9PSEU|nr:recombinase family protein [Allosaccharopolyspora coralli]